MLFLLCLIISQASFGVPNNGLFDNVSCKKNPLFCQICKFKPNVNKEWAMKLSNLLFKYGKAYSIDPWRSLAIAMQESSLKNQSRKRKVLIYYDFCEKNKCAKKYKYVEGLSDVGLFQFHVNTIIYNKINPLRLATDLEYTVEQHFLLLSKKQKQCQSLGKEAWACYHSKNKKYRDKYVKLVNRYFIDKKMRASNKVSEALQKHMVVKAQVL